MSLELHPDGVHARPVDPTAVLDAAVVGGALPVPASPVAPAAPAVERTELSALPQYQTRVTRPKRRHMNPCMVADQKHGEISHAGQGVKSAKRHKVNRAADNRAHKLATERFQLTAPPQQPVPPASLPQVQLAQKTKEDQRLSRERVPDNPPRSGTGQRRMRSTAFLPPPVSFEQAPLGARQDAATPQLSGEVCFIIPS